MKPVARYFRNRFEKDRRTQIIAHTVHYDAERCALNNTLEEITEAEALASVRRYPSNPNLWGIAREGLEFYNRRKHGKCVIVPKAPDGAPCLKDLREIVDGVLTFGAPTG